MKLFGAILATLGSVVLAETKIKFCGDFPVTYQSLSTDQPSANSLPVDVILHLYCPRFHSNIDFGKHSQNLTAFAHGSNAPANQFFLKADFGDHFLMKKANDPNDKGTNITLVHEIMDMSHEDSLKFQMFPVSITRRDEFPKLENNETYIEAHLHNKGINGDKVKLTPALAEKLKSSEEMVTRTMIPEKGSHLVQQEVYIMRGWLNTTQYSGLHASLSRGAKAIEYITIFLEKPVVKDLAPAEVKITVQHYVGSKLQHEHGSLTPGWLGYLDVPTKQKLEIFKDPHNKHSLPSQEVTIWPGSHPVKSPRGWAATYNTGYAIESITIYAHPELGPPEKNPANQGGMFVDVELVKQVNQTIADTRAALTPGWFNELKGPIKLTVSALADDWKSSFTGRDAIVSPGWKTFIDDEGFNALYRYDNAQYPINVIFAD